jgi:WD40 repeat protein
MADVFISYSRRDSNFVTQLADELRRREKDVWVDVEGLRDAEVFPEALRRAIEGSDAFVFVISPDSVRSTFCEEEVSHASNLNKRIVPLALHAVPDAEIPEQIRFRNWIPVGDEGRAAAHMTVERVVAALDTDLDWEQQHTRITVRALQWENAGRETSFLLRGAELASAERWLAAGAGKDPGPTALEQQYLLAGRHAAARRQRAMMGGVVAIAAVSLGLLIFALISRGQAVTAKSSAQAQALAAVSETQQSVDPERAVLLAMAAVRTKATYGTLGTMFALRAALDASTVRYRLPPVGVQACSGPAALLNAPGAAYDPAAGSNLLAEGTCDGTIVLANATTGKVERRVHLAGGPAVNLQYTSDGSALVVAVAGTYAHILELDPVTGQVRREAPPVVRFEGFTVDPRAPLVAIASPGVLAYWNLTTGRLTVTHTPGSTLTIVGLTYTPDGREIAATFPPGPGPGLVLYDVAQRRIVATEPLPSTANAAFSPNGRELAVGESLQSGGRIVVLDARTLAVDRHFTPISAPDVSPSALAFSPDGTRLAYGFADGTAGLVSASTGQTIDTYLGDTAAITAVSFTPDGKLVATASSDGAVRASRAGGLALRHVMADVVGGQVEADTGGFVSMSDVGPNLNSITPLPGRGGPPQGLVVQRWSDAGQPLGAPLVLSRTPIVDASFLSRGGRFAGIVPAPSSSAASSHGSPAGRLELWNLPERRLVRTVKLAEVPSGREPVLSADGNWMVMNVPSIRGPNGPIQLVLVNLRTGRERALPANANHCTATWDAFDFTRNDRYVAAGTFCGQMSMFDVATGRKVGKTLDIGGEIAWSSFSPDGRHLAIASWDGTVKVSPVPLTGRPVSLTENTKGVPDVEWSPDGRYLESAGLDHTVRIFDARTLQELRVITQPDAVIGAVFTPDSRNVISYDNGSNVWLWDACTGCENPRGLLALARSRVTRSLTPQERAEFGVS